jgi:hypothetical protein
MTLKAEKTKNITTAGASFTSRPILGLSGHPILSGAEHNYVKWHRPTNVQAYMRIYVEALRSQPRGS